MRSLINLHLKSTLKSPTLYLITFLLSPLLFILASSFIPAFIVFPIVLVINAMIIIFFVIGTSLIQTKNSVVYKRIEATGITKTQFILSFGFLSFALALSSIYIIIELFATVSGLDNASLWFANTMDINANTTKTFVPQIFNWFVVDDLFIALDDGVWLLITDLVRNVSDFDLLIDNLQKIIDSNYFGAGVNWIIENIIGTLKSYGDSGNEIANNMQAQFDMNGHAPIGLVTSLFFDPLTGNSNVSTVDGLSYDFYNKTVSADTQRTYTFYFGQAETDLFMFKADSFFIHFAPTITTIFSPLLNFGTTVAKNTFNEPTMLLFRWLEYFAFFCIAILALYSLMLVMTSFTNNTEKYLTLSGFGFMLIMIFSGILVPMSIIMSTPMIFIFANMIPTTPIFAQLSYMWASVDLDLLISPTNNLTLAVVYPIVFSVLLLFVNFLNLGLNNDNSKNRIVGKLRVKSILLLVLFLIEVFILRSTVERRMISENRELLYWNMLYTLMFTMIGVTFIFGIKLTWNFLESPQIKNKK